MKRSGGPDEQRNLTDVDAENDHPYLVIKPQEITVELRHLSVAAHCNRCTISHVFRSIPWFNLGGDDRIIGSRTVKEFGDRVVDRK